MNIIMIRRGVPRLYTDVVLLFIPHKSITYMHVRGPRTITIHRHEHVPTYYYISDTNGDDDDYDDDDNYDDHDDDDDVHV